MNLRNLVKTLQTLGIPVIKIEVADDETDGLIAITELVHIQVPEEGNKVCVVAMSADEEEFTHYPMREYVHHLVADLRDALGLKSAE